MNGFDILNHDQFPLYELEVGKGEAGWMKRPDRSKSLPDPCSRGMVREAGVQYRLHLNLARRRAHAHH